MPLPATAPGVMVRTVCVDGIEVGDVVVLLGVGRAVLPAQAEVEGQLGNDLPVVLRVDAVEGLAKVRDEVVGQRVGVGGAEEEVGPVVVARLPIAPLALE